MSPIFETSCHPIEDLDGVGPERAEELALFGVHHTEDLLFGDRQQVAREISQVSGISFSMAYDEFYPLALLMRIRELEPEDAEAMFEAGLRDVSAVAWGPPGWLEDNFPDADEARRRGWQLDAARRLETGVVTVSVVDESGAPVSDALVEAVNPLRKQEPHSVSWRTRANGNATCEYLRPGRIEVVVKAEGFAQAKGAGWSAANTASRTRVQLEAGDPEAPLVDETADGIVLPNIGRPTRRITEDGAPPDGVDGAQLTALGEEARLTALRWQQNGAITEQRSYLVPASEVPPEVEVGDVLTRSGPGWDRSELGWQEWRDDQRGEVGS